MTQSPGAQFERLLEIMRRLREPGGCPWDREQTRASLKPFLVEETYEVLEAIESGEAEALREELGDLLLQVVFRARPRSERGRRPARAGRLPRSDRGRARRVRHGGAARAPRRQDDQPPSARLRRDQAGHSGRGARAVGGDQAARGPRGGAPTLRHRRRAARAALAAARAAHHVESRAGELRLARRARGVVEGRGGVPRGRGRPGRRRPRPAAGRAGRRAVFPRERRAPGLDRRGGGAAGRDREVPAAVHRHGGRSERAGQERGERVAGRARALVGSGEGAGARAMKAKVGSASIAVERGDITDREVDALVNPANTALTMTTGVAAAIKRKGGVIIEEEAMRQGPVEVGEALLTPGGNLQATHVIHAVVMGPDLKTDAEVIARATRAVLAVADKHRLTSIALPALGTGLGHVAPGAAADAMMEAVAAHLKGGKTALKRVVFVLYLDDAYRAFTDTLKRVGGIQ